MDLTKNNKNNDSSRENNLPNRGRSESSLQCGPDNSDESSAPDLGAESQESPENAEIQQNDERLVIESSSGQKNQCIDSLIPGTSGSMEMPRDSAPKAGTSGLCATSANTSGRFNAQVNVYDGSTSTVERSHGSTQADVPEMLDSAAKAGTSGLCATSANTSGRFDAQVNVYDGSTSTVERSHGSTQADVPEMNAPQPNLTHDQSGDESNTSAEDGSSGFNDEFEEANGSAKPGGSCSPQPTPPGEIPKTALSSSVVPSGSVHPGETGGCRNENDDSVSKQAREGGGNVEYSNTRAFSTQADSIVEEENSKSRRFVLLDWLRLFFSLSWFYLPKKGKKKSKKRVKVPPVVSAVCPLEERRDRPNTPPVRNAEFDVGGQENEAANGRGAEPFGHHGQGVMNWCALGQWLTIRRLRLRQLRWPYGQGDQNGFPIPCSSDITPDGDQPTTGAMPIWDGVRAELDNRHVLAWLHHQVHFLAQRTRLLSNVMVARFISMLRTVFRAGQRAIRPIVDQPLDDLAAVAQNFMPPRNIHNCPSMIDENYCSHCPALRSQVPRVCVDCGGYMCANCACYHQFPGVDDTMSIHCNPPMMS